jgi:hypothetical protein
MPGRLTHYTTNHDTIRDWAEARDGQPSSVKRTRGGRGKNDPGIIRIDFPGYSGEGSLEPISWDEFFEKFDDGDLVFVYQEETARGQQSNFNKFVRPENIDRRKVDDDQLESGRGRRSGRARSGRDDDRGAGGESGSRRGSRSSSRGSRRDNDGGTSSSRRGSTSASRTSRPRSSGSRGGGRGSQTRGSARGSGSRSSARSRSSSRSR